MSGPGEPRPLTRLARRGALASIQAYQGARTGRPSPCRFWPTCSAYSAEAIEEHGLWRGGLLSARRLLRCRPFGRRGVDLVPVRTALREENA